MRELEGVDEAELVQEDHECRDADIDPVRARDPERTLPPPGVGPEDGDRDEVTNRRVRERQPTVLEHVLRDGDVERPEQNRTEQHRVHGRDSPHALERTFVDLRSDAVPAWLTRLRGRLTRSCQPEIAELIQSDSNGPTKPYHSRCREAARGLEARTAPLHSDF